MGNFLKKFKKTDLLEWYIFLNSPKAEEISKTAGNQEKKTKLKTNGYNILF